MEPENRPRHTEDAGLFRSLNEQLWPESGMTAPGETPYSELPWIFAGPGGLRAGWCALIFVLIAFVFLFILGSFSTPLAGALHLDLGQLSPGVMILQEGVFLLALVLAALVMTRVERRRLLDYNLTGPHRLAHFASGLAAGFAVLSALVGVMTWRGSLHFGPRGLNGAQILHYGVLWAFAFLLLGLSEEGGLRGYLQFTLTRGLNFWWALATVLFLIVICLAGSSGNGAAGVYVAGLLGLVPCLLLHLRKAPGSAFWQAAWVTSTLFAFVHIFNSGESWIGILAAAGIGFVFCVSIRLTGSAWWAIGCHISWDWSESYLYGVANSGVTAQGHFLASSPVGNPLWSGGTSGPEGSLLVLPAILLLLVLLLLLYGRGRPPKDAVTEPRQPAG